MTRGPISRRTLLRGAGGVAIALPWLEAMAPRRASAAVSPKRFVVFFTPNGTNSSSKFMPQGSATDFTLGRETDPLLPHKKDLLVLSGINMKTASSNAVGDLHSIGMSHMLTCAKAVKADGAMTAAGDKFFVSYGGGISIDQKIAQILKPPTKFATLELGVQSTLGIGPHPFSRMVYEDRLRPKPATDDPREAFRKLFTNLTAPGSDSGDALAQALAQRKSVLDFVSEEFKRVSTRVSAGDKRKIDGHLQAIRQVERQLVPGGASTACKVPAAPGTINDQSLKDPRSLPAIGKLQMDLLTLALACDLTRIASLQWSWARSRAQFAWIGVRDGHHDLTHQPASEPLSEINRWYAQQIAYQVAAFKAITEGDRTLLDNTVVYWCSDVAAGANHGFGNIRAFLFGSCGGFFKTGQHVKLAGLPHNKLMVTFMRAMGISDAQQFGAPEIEPGPLPGLG